MKNKGFTLIELLIVVLIIGILAAIAVPQYKLSVYRSTYAKLRLALTDISRAQQLYYLNNGKYAEGGQEDQIETHYPVKDSRFIIDSKITCKIQNSGGPMISCTVNNAIIQHWLAKNPMSIQCLTYAPSNFAGEKFCQFITNTTQLNSSSDSYVHSYSGPLTHI